MESDIIERRQLTRRRFLTDAAIAGAFVGGLPALLAACASPSASGSVASASPTSSSLVPSPSTAASPSLAAIEDIIVQLGWFKNVEFAGLYAAEKAGFSEAQRVKQQLLPGGPQSDAFQIVASGAALVGVASGSTALVEARANGLPIKAIAAQFQKSPACIMSLADAPLKSVQDMVGKKIALQPSARSFWDVVLKLNNLPADAVTIVTAADDPTPLVSHQVDGFLAFASNQPVALKLKGIDTYLLSTWDMGYRNYANVYCVLDSALAEHEDLLVRWLRSAIQGWTYYLDHQDEIVAYTVGLDPSAKLDLKQQTIEAQIQNQFLESPLTDSKGLLSMDPAVFQAGIDLLKTSNQSASPVAVNDVMTTTILEKALVGITF